MRADVGCPKLNGFWAGHSSVPIAQHVMRPPFSIGSIDRHATLLQSILHNKRADRFLHEMAPFPDLQRIWTYVPERPTSGIAGRTRYGN